MAIVPVTGQVPIPPQPRWGRTATVATDNQATDHGRVSPPPHWCRFCCRLPPPSPPPHAGPPCRGCPGGGGMDGCLASGRRLWGIGVGDRSSPPHPRAPGAHARRGRGCCCRSSPGATAVAPWARRRRQRTAAGSWTASRSRRARLPRRPLWPAAFISSRRPPSISRRPLAGVGSAARRHHGDDTVLYCACWGWPSGRGAHFVLFPRDLAAYGRPYVTRTNPLCYYSVGPG